jgi:hypothetical protein
MFRKALALFSIVTLSFVVFSFQPAFAATSSPANNSPVDFSSLGKTCAVIEVHVSGTNHTVNCRVSRASGLVVNIGRDDSCDTTVDQITIYNTAAGNNTILCFGGDGYMGVDILHINEIDDNVLPACPPAQVCQSQSEGIWFRWYQPGTYTALVPGHSKVFGSGVTSIEITQLCIGDVNFPSC